MIKQQKKPRNPFVVDAKFRKAGAHGKTNKAKRCKNKIELNRTIKSIPEQYQKQISNKSVFATA